MLVRLCCKMQKAGGGKLLRAPGAELTIASILGAVLNEPFLTRTVLGRRSSHPMTEIRAAYHPDHGQLDLGRAY